MAKKKGKKLGELVKADKKLGADWRKGFGKAKPKPKPKPRSVPKPIDRPPPGYYDPALDAQERAAARGLGDLTSDTTTQGVRNTTDFILGQEDIARQRRELGQDVGTAVQGVETNYGRSLSDLLNERKQAGEDYTANLAQLQRNYDILGSQQAQVARAAGVSAGGATAQAAAKRAANQAWERKPIDTSYNRFQQASATSEQRLGQDRQTTLADLLRQQQRGNEALDRSGGQLNLSYQRGGEDLTTQLARAQRENVFYGQDINTARLAQAAQLGWSPTAPLKGTAQPRPTPKPKPRRRGRARSGRPRPNMASGQGRI